jgi:tetratricopeptide (TPR) repeat protein
MASKDIEKLKEKFEKDSNSKLFLPLAEEYRKEGMLDEAIDVLQQGIERHSSYTSARVLLGKIYFEKGMTDEARREFESVVKIVPDNLFAHRKLAEVYRASGEPELAVKTLKTVLRLNPLDDESVTSLREIEALLSPALPALEPTGVVSQSVEKEMTEKLANEESVYLHHEDEISTGAAVDRVKHSEEELNAFKDSLFGGKANFGDESETDHEDLPAVQNAVDKFDAVNISEEEASEGDVPSFASIASGIQTEDVSGSGQQPASTIAEADATELAEELKEPGGHYVNMFLDEPAAVVKNKTVGVADGDRFVGEGKFAEAMSAYKMVLASDPDNKMVLQRAEELRALLSLMGKDKEMLVAGLNSFLERIYKRRDGFFGRT